MIAWLVGIITVILVLLVISRSFSREFRRRSEQPKYDFLRSLGIPLKDSISSSSGDPKDAASKSTTNQEKNP